MFIFNIVYRLCSAQSIQIAATLDVRHLVLFQEQKLELTDSLREYLFRVIENVTDGLIIQRLSEDFGAKHVRFRSQGFRPDFFAMTADAVTTECVLLDGAVHAASDALAAWLMNLFLVFLIFASRCLFEKVRNL